MYNRSKEIDISRGKKHLAELRLELQAPRRTESEK
jgi:hypothetical protein